MLAWASVTSIFFFLTMKRLNKLKVDEVTEILGLDAGELGLHKNLLKDLRGQHKR